MKISKSGIIAQKIQLQVTAENIANAMTIRTETGLPYRKKYVLFKSTKKDGVFIGGIAKSNQPFRQVYDPGNPLADAQGFVYLPNVDISEEMVNMNLTNILYEANTTVYKSAKSMYQQSLDLLK